MVKKHIRKAKDIRAELADFLKKYQIKRVFFAQNSLPPPSLAYIVNFGRLSIPLTGNHQMEIEQNGKICQIKPKRGEAVYIPPNCWNKPTWAFSVKVLTILFGKKQTGISLVIHDGKSAEPASAFKTNINYPVKDVPKRILDTLNDFSSAEIPESVDCLLVEALLHCCLELLITPREKQKGKPHHIFENICLYVQENFQTPLNRKTVAAHFKITPNHVSRLFKNEGYMKFNDYLTYVRIDRAKFMLKQYDMSLDEIASGCGYAETAYFCRIFKQITKLTPTAYRIRSRK